MKTKSKRKSKYKKGNTFKYISLLEFHVKLCIFFQFEIFYFYYFAHIKLRIGTKRSVYTTKLYIHLFPTAAVFIIFPFYFSMHFRSAAAAQEFSLDFVITYLRYVCRSVREIFFLFLFLFKVHSNKRFKKQNKMVIYT